MFCTTYTQTAAAVERERGPSHAVEIDSGTGPPPKPVAVIHVIAADHHSPPLRSRVVRREKERVA